MSTLRGTYDVSVNAWGDEFEKMARDREGFLKPLTHANLKEMLKLIQDKELTFFNIYKSAIDGKLFVGKHVNREDLQDVDTIHIFVIYEYRKRLGTRSLDRVEKEVYQYIKQANYRMR